MLENIDKIIEFVTMLTTVLFVVCRSNANVKKKIDEHLTPNGGNSVRDIVDRIDKKLMALEATQRALLDLREDIVGHFLADKEGNFFWVSDKFGEIVGLERGDCAGLEWIKCIRPEEEVSVYSNWKLKTITGETASFTFTTRNGKEVEFRAVPVIDERDNLIGFVGNIKILS